jgi:hypothetical protein
MAVLMGGLLLGSVGLRSADAVQPVPKAGARKNNERHPHIRRALHELREAKKDLKTADHDFGGHRVEAIGAIDVAIKQLEVALKFDRK